mgnify:CR=1 FL=1
MPQFVQNMVIHPVVQHGDDLYLAAKGVVESITAKVNPIAPPVYHGGVGVDHTFDLVLKSTSRLSSTVCS